MIRTDRDNHTINTITQLIAYDDTIGGVWEDSMGGWSEKVHRNIEYDNWLRFNG